MTDAATPPLPSAAPDLPTASPAVARPRAPSAWQLGWRQLQRDFRAGELRLLVFAVTLAVAALTAVGFFADRINTGITRDARQLLGGDAVVSSDQPAPPAFTAEARAMGLLTATSASFPSMGRAPDAKGGATRLVSVKAVSDAWPLRGGVTLREPGAVAPGTRTPAPGTVWVDRGILDSLGLAIGDELMLGDSALRVAAVIGIEPDRGTGFQAFAPRVLMSEADLAATGLVQPASRITYRLAVASRDNRDGPVNAYIAWAEKHMDESGARGIRVESFENGQPQMRQTLDRAEKFLNLVALLAALLAAVAVGIAARDFASRHLDDCAMLRVLGVSQRTIAGQYLVAFFLVGLLASVAGVAIGWGVHHVFVWFLAGIVSAALPPAGAWPAVFGLGVGFTLLFAFGLPPVLQLARVPPLRVIRRDLGTLKPASVAVLVCGIAGFAALLVAVASDLRMGLIAVGGFAGALALFAIASWLALGVLRRSVPEAAAPRWLVLATRQIAARPGFAVLQVSALAVGLLALILLTLLRTDLVSGWRQATPKDAPDRIVINVQPPQAEAFRRQLEGAGVTRYDWFPMIRGRLVAIDGEPIDTGRWSEERARGLVEREFNLSHTAALPEHNEIVAGRWVPGEAGALSVEEGLAQTLGLKLGQTLRFDAGGLPLEGRITSLRKVDWSSMRANFFVLFPTAGIEAPATYIAAFRAPPQAGFDNALARAFPNLTTVDVTASIAQVQRVLDQVVRAVEFLFAFTLGAGLLVLFAAIGATRESRAREFAVMRALGAGAGLLAKVQRAELLGTGALAGVLASVAAMAVSWALARWVFQFEWQPKVWVPLAGGAVGALLALAAGWWSLREVLRRPVVHTLRQAAE